MTKPFSSSTRWRALPLLVTGCATLLAALLFVSPLSGCLNNTSDSCLVDGVAPINVQAQSGTDTVTITWEIPAFDTNTISSVWAQVQYDTAGGDGPQCNRYHPNDLAPGCAVACQLSSATTCNVSVPGTYKFTIVTQATPKNPYCGAGTASARTDALTIGAP